MGSLCLYHTFQVEHLAEHGKGIVYQLPQFVSTYLTSVQICIHNTVTKLNILINKQGKIWPQNPHQHNYIAFRNNGHEQGCVVFKSLFCSPQNKFSAIINSYITMMNNFSLLLHFTLFSWRSSP